MQTLRQGFPQVEIATQRDRKRIAPGTSSRLALLGDQLGAAVGAAAAARSNLRAQRASQCCCNAPSKKSFSRRTKSQDIRILRASAVLAFD
jgi:hypothetical protein